MARLTSMATGVATADPIQATDVVRSSCRRFNLSRANQIGGEYVNHGVVPDVGSFDGALLAVSFRDGQDHHTIGSAVLLHPGVALTAKHVVQDWLERIAAGSGSAVCQAARQAEVLLWDVEGVTTVLEGDLAVLSLRGRSALPPNNEYVVGHATTRMPQVGDPVFLCGFSAEAASLPVTSRIEIRGMLRAAHGRVIDVWPSGRDRFMLPSASFAVDCPAFGGMSGGPVFDGDGYLIGVVSSSSEGEEIAFVSHVWPALVAGIKPVWPWPMQVTSLIHLGSRNGVCVRRPDAFSLDVRDGSLVLKYTPWS